MKKLSPEQLEALRIAPLGSLTNKLQIAFALVDEQQSAACAVTGLRASALSKLVRGAYQSVDVEITRGLADAFGCAIEDLFPERAKDAVAS